MKLTIIWSQGKLIKEDLYVCLCTAIDYPLSQIIGTTIDSIDFSYGVYTNYGTTDSTHITTN